jgi:hypothetical protein
MMASNEESHEDRPASGAVIALAALLAFVAATGLAGAISVVVMLLFFVDNFALGSPGARQVMALLAVCLLTGAAALWALSRLKPRLTRKDPVAPSTTRTDRLFWWSAVASIPGALALIFATMSREVPLGLFSNSPISPGIGIFIIVSWLLSMAISWWWYFSSDEHQRRAYDFGSLVGCGVFLTLTPAWWIGARAGLLPQPDAMILWAVTAIIIMVGWFWRRYC